MTIDQLTLTSAEVFPTEGDPSKDMSLDLLTPDRSCYVTVQTLEVAKDDGVYDKPGNYMGGRGVRDIILDVPNLTPENVQESLDELSKETGVNYHLDV